MTNPEFMLPLRPSAPLRLCAELFGFVLALSLMLTVQPQNLSAQTVATIKPGMTEADVRTAWGEPFTVRKAGTMAYMYYKNDCLRTCGTHDVVFLENGQVVDAVVRDKNRRYDGIASSPPERKPEATVQ